jgi:phosphoribosylpyrophosphate synthetase
MSRCAFLLNSHNWCFQLDVMDAIKPASILRGDAIVIDDVVTTGATLQEAARALNSRGFHAFGSDYAVTACVTQPLR